MKAAVAQIVTCTEAEGPGRRFALWFQGCPLRCPGCCNPEMLPFAGGTSMTVEDIVSMVRETRDIEGISLLGGEPFAHADAAALIARAAQNMHRSVMIYSGYTLEEIRAMPQPAAAELLRHTDLLVDGPYVRERPESRRRWVGSTNQRLHFLSTRYRADDPCWLRPNSIEIRFRDGELAVNGFPAPAAVGLWRRPLKIVP